MTEFKKAKEEEMAAKEFEIVQNVDGILTTSKKELARRMEENEIFYREYKLPTSWGGVQEVEKYIALSKDCANEDIQLMKARINNLKKTIEEIATKITDLNVENLETKTQEIEETMPHGVKSDLWQIEQTLRKTKNLEVTMQPHDINKRILPEKFLEQIKPKILEKFNTDKKKMIVRGEGTEVKTEEYPIPERDPNFFSVIAVNHYKKGGEYEIKNIKIVSRSEGYAKNIFGDLYSNEGLNQLLKMKDIVDWNKPEKLNELIKGCGKGDYVENLLEFENWVAKNLDNYYGRG